MISLVIVDLMIELICYVKLFGNLDSPTQYNTILYYAGNNVDTDFVNLLFGQRTMTDWSMHFTLSIYIAYVGVLQSKEKRLTNIKGVTRSLRRRDKTNTLFVFLWHFIA